MQKMAGSPVSTMCNEVKVNVSADFVTFKNEHVTYIGILHPEKALLCEIASKAV